MLWYVGRYLEDVLLRKRIPLLIFVGLFVLQACGGRTANPVVQYQPGDENRTCSGLQAEIAYNESEIVKLLPKESATGKNVALAVTGAFLIVPLFFMDFKDAEGIEIQAYRRRNMWLREVAASKNCSLPPPRVQFETEEGADPADPEPKLTP